MLHLGTFLNSAFGVSFFSSVVVAGIAAAYTIHQKNSREKTRKRQIWDRINLEISTRISEGLAALRLEPGRLNRSEKEARYQYFCSAMYGEALSYLDNRVSTVWEGQTIRVDYSIYPEYQHRSFRSLTYELGTVANPGTTVALRAARLDYKRLVDITDQAETQAAFDKDAALDAVKTCIQMLERLQANSFWRDPE